MSRQEYDAHAQRCLEEWKRKHESKTDRDAFCERLKKGSPRHRQATYVSSCSEDPFVLPRFKPLLDSACDIVEPDKGPMRRSTSAEGRFAPAGPAGSPAGPARSRPRPEAYDIGDCEDYTDAPACRDNVKCSWTGERCLPRGVMHIAMHAEDQQAQASRAALLGILGLASAVTAAAAARPDYGAPAQAASVGPRPRSLPTAAASMAALRRRTDIRQLLQEKPLYEALPGLINQTPRGPWGRRLREALQGASRPRAQRR